RVASSPPGDGTGGQTDTVVTMPDAGVDRRPEAVVRPPDGDLCGNNTLNLPDETCDDGNQQSGDGCSANCQTETDWICPEPGQPCTSTVKCGDGVISGA